MAFFKDIIGHGETVEHLQNAIRSGRVSHAYIIQGPKGSGKMMLAEAFAQTLQCENVSIGQAAASIKAEQGAPAKTEQKAQVQAEQGAPTQTRHAPLADACGSCHSCHMAETHNHPDIVYVQHEKPNLYRVEEIREQIVGDVQIKPYYGKKKIYIIEDADKMNTAAQNTLLKTLEEPPAYALILLLTTNAQALLETIRSRSITLNLRGVPDDQVIHYLMEKAQVPDYQAKLCAAFAQGSIGRAMELASSDYFQQIRGTMLKLVRRIKEMNVTELTEMVKEASEYKLTINDFLDLLAVWYRDVLYFKASRDADALVFKDQVPLIRKNAAESSYEGLQIILEALQKAQTRLNANVNFDLTMELLFLTIKEN